MAASQSRGTIMQRTQSIMEFQQLMKNDAKSALRSELDRLGNTASTDKKEVLAFVNVPRLFKSIKCRVRGLFIHGNAYNTLC